MRGEEVASCWPDGIDAPSPSLMHLLRVKDQHLARLEWFVIRARRVEEHSLAQDLDQLLVWASGTFTLSGVQGQPPSTLRWSLPPEEPLDSLAARCRPFIVKNDSVYWAQVTAALGYFLHLQTPDDGDDLPGDLQRMRETWRNVRAAWRPFDRETPSPLGYLSRASSNGEPLGEAVDAKALAYAWLYSDLVHADDIQGRVGDHDIDDRYRAGAILIANVARCAIMTLNLVRLMKNRGLVELPDEAFTQPVLANPDAALTITRGAMGPVGTSLADMESALDAGASDSGAD